VAVQDELPQSRITLKYRTTINGEEEEINLPMRTLVMGDLGSSKDRRHDLDQRELRSITGRGNLDELMKDMEISLDLRVPNHVAPEKGELEIKLPVSGMKSFSPDEVAKNVPAVRSLMLLKTLLLEMQSNIDNRREIRKLILEVCAHPEKLQAVLAELKGYESLRLPDANKKGG